MTNEQLNTMLYNNMFAEQEQYRERLLICSPDQILSHAYEYTLREDILLSMEYNDLSDEQCMALLKSETPIADIFEVFESTETDYMDKVLRTIVCTANKRIRDGSMR